MPGPGKRPRSSISPTIVLDRHGQAMVALGSPGGATIVTTVLQTLTGFLDRHLPLVDAISRTPRQPAQRRPDRAGARAVRRRPEEAAGGHRAPLQAEPGDRRGDRGAAAARREMAGRRRGRYDAAAARRWW
ncbi:gamma-glutamyltransferase family protein [Streptomyces tricolor]|nr:gamma-glutamyltransferase family protein [Streptomyces tricolor]